MPHYHTGIFLADMHSNTKNYNHYCVKNVQEAQNNKRQANQEQAEYSRSNKLVQSRYELLQNYNIHIIFLIYILCTKPIDCDWRDCKLIQSDDPAKNYRYSILKSCREQYLVPFDGTNETTTHHTTTKKLSCKIHVRDHNGGTSVAQCEK